MVLVFGGTTEGRKAVEVLEEAGKVYYYSTKTGEQDITLHHGQHIGGAMDAEAMQAFCREHDLRLIVDAAHPFASQLHQTIAQVSETLNIPAIRYERIYPTRDPDITWIDDYSQVPRDIHSLLATTGVQSISKLKYLEALGIKVIYRILNRKSSIQLANQQGATNEQLCYYEDIVGNASKRYDVVGNASQRYDVVGNASQRYNSPVSAAAKLGSFTHCDAILMKESGLSGGFQEKVEAAKQQGMRIIVLKRPEWSMTNGPLGSAAWLVQEWSMVNGPYGLRRAVEKLLPEFYPLHSGLTTGTCATAAAVAATIRLLKNETPDEVPVVLPNGETIMVAVGYGERLRVGASAGIGYAYCIKEAGDDPDVTNGIEIRASVVGHAS